MIFRNKTRSINKKLTHLKPGASYWLGVNPEGHLDKLQEIGFSVPLESGEQILVSAHYGPACKRNAEGREIVHRDQEMETAYRQMEWHWTEFRGRYDTVEQSKIVDVPYQRYPRTVLPPYAVELKIRSKEGGEDIVVAGPFTLSEDGNEIATNTQNMFMEIFGECMVLQPDLSLWNKIPTKRLNWELLPPGKNPWASAQAKLSEIVSKAEKGKQPVIQARFETIGHYNPEYVAIGLGGFDGYVVFGFPRIGICVLESRSVNNATYVLDEGSWEAISSLTKAEILDEKLHRERLIHREKWFRDISVLLIDKKAG